MKLEEALNLKEGTEVLATTSYSGSNKITEGELYVIEENVRVLWPGPDRINRTSYKRLRKKDAPCDAELPIIDDNGKLIYSSFYYFKKR